MGMLRKTRRTLAAAYLKRQNRKHEGEFGAGVKALKEGSAALEQFRASIFSDPRYRTDAEFRERMNVLYDGFVSMAKENTRRVRKVKARRGKERRIARIIAGRR